MNNGRNLTTAAEHNSECKGVGGSCVLCERHCNVINYSAATPQPIRIQALDGKGPPRGQALATFSSI